MTCATGFCNAIRVLILRREPSPLPVAEPTGFTTVALPALACKIAPICLIPDSRRLPGQSGDSFRVPGARPTGGSGMAAARESGRCGTGGPVVSGHRTNLPEASTSGSTAHPSRTEKDRCDASAALGRVSGSSSGRVRLQPSVHGARRCVGASSSCAPSAWLERPHNRNKRERRRLGRGRQDEAV